MINNYRKSVSKAISNYHAKMDKKQKGPQRRNSKPEKDVETACMAWMRANGFSVQVVESKSTYNKQIERWVSQSVKVGTCDCIGNDKNGIAVFVEFKAPAALGTLKDHQREFLIKKINSGCFGACVNSVELLSTHYQQWSQLPLDQRQAFLLQALPKPRVSRSEDDDGPLFEE